jgi:hypothetical protein
MQKQKKETEVEKRKRLSAELARDRRIRASGYRDRALKLFPNVCASCGREFSGKRLRELTVHHVDHDFKNNPNDGSNWMLLCLYCHDNEHESHSKNARSTKAVTVGEAAPPVANPFAGLDDLLSG